MIYLQKENPEIVPAPQFNPIEPTPQTNPIKPTLPEIVPGITKATPTPVIPEIKPFIQPEIKAT